MGKKKKSKFSGKVSEDVKRQRSQASSYGYLKLPQGIGVYKPVPGEIARFDILPYYVTTEAHPDRSDDTEVAVSGEQWYKRPFWIHRNVGASSETVVCLQSFGEKCPVCEYRAQRLKDGAPKEEIASLQKKARNLYIVVPIGDSEHEQVPHIYDASHFLFQKLLNDEILVDEDREDFPDLKDGKTLVVRFDKEKIGKNPPFARATRIDFEDRENEYPDDVVGGIDLDAVLTKLSYEQMAALFYENGDAVVEDGDVASKEDNVASVEEYEELDSLPDDLKVPKEKKKKRKKKKGGIDG